MTARTVSEIAAQAVRAERRRRSDRFWTRVIWYVLTVIAVAVAAWMLMLLVGIAHHDWVRALPTLGYSTAVWLAVLGMSLVRAVKLGSSSYAEFAKAVERA